jgi:hypothetical protein
MEMSIWCECTLTVTGGKKAVAALVSAAKGYDRQYDQTEAEKHSLMARYGTLPTPKLEAFCFHALVPVPDQILAKGFDRFGHDWEVKHWGCKWGALDIRVRPCPMPRGGKVVYKFRTPNSSPSALLDVVAKDHPTLKLVLVVECEQEGGRVTTTWNKGVRRE